MTEVCEGHVTVTDPTHPLFGRVLTLVGLATLQSHVRHCQVALDNGQVVYIPIASTDRSSVPRPEPTVLAASAIEHLVRVFQATAVARRTRHATRDEPARLGSPEPHGPGSRRRRDRPRARTGGGA